MPTLRPLVLAVALAGALAASCARTGETEPQAPEATPAATPKSTGDEIVARVAVGGITYVIRSSRRATAQHHLDCLSHSTACSEWERARPGTERTIADCTRLLARPDVVDLVARITRFYGPELGDGAEMPIDLVLVPRPSSGAPRGMRHGSGAAVEISPDETAETTLGILLHEVFHRWFASISPERAARRARRFVDTRAEDAMFAYGLLDEVLATVATNVLTRAVAPDRFEERLKAPRGFDADEPVDLVTRTFLLSFEDLLAKGARLDDPETVNVYFAAVMAAYPEGAPPRLAARPFVALFEPELKMPFDALDGAVSAAQKAQNDDLSYAASGLLFEGRHGWAHVVLVRTSKVEALRAWTKELGEPVVTRVLAEARKRSTFVLTERRAGSGPVFVFVAPEAVAMTGLVTRYFARTRTETGVVTE